MARTKGGVTSTVSDLTLIGIDPGKMTGVAMWDASEGGTPHVMQLEVDPFFSWVNTTLLTGKKYDIICEAFVISQRTVKGSSQTWSLEHIGLLKWASWRMGHMFTLQQASAAKKFSTNDRLKEFGWYTPGMDHANDACRHLLLHALKRGVVSL